MAGAAASNRKATKPAVGKRQGDQAEPVLVLGGKGTCKSNEQPPQRLPNQLFFMGCGPFTGLHLVSGMVLD